MAKRVIVRQQRQLKAIQMMTFQHPEGGEGLMMIDDTGTIYLKGEQGWKAFDMMEEPTNGTTI